MRERVTLPGDETRKIKRAVRKMLGKAKDLGVAHIEQELGLQPRTYAKKSLFPTMDADLNRYETEKAFWITGLVKEDILKVAKAYLFNYAKEHPEAAEGGDGFEEGLYETLREWLPVKDANGRTINHAARSEVIARTNIMDIYNHTRLTMMRRPELQHWVQGYRYSAILDSVTTPICRHLHGKIFTSETLNGFSPPLHFNCRSMLLPVTQLDEGWRHEMDKQDPITVTPQEGFASGVDNPPLIQEAATGKASQ